MSSLRIQLPNVSISAVVLFDSGALHASYVSKCFVDKHRVGLTPYLSPVDIETRLADSKTTLKITEVLSVPLQFTGPDGRLYRGEERLNVMPSMSEEIIVGLPTILSQSLHLYVAMLQECHILNEVHNLQHLREVIDPWSHTEEPAPEDDMIPDPC